MSRLFFAFIFCSMIFVSSYADDCVFGETLDDLYESDAFEMDEVGNAFKKSKIEEIDGKDILVSVNKLVQLKNGRVFVLNYTFDDEYDGGNTIGWIEDSETETVVATIGDSEIYRCVVSK